jgi:putative DNA primase/helicase
VTVALATNPIDVAGARQHDTEDAMATEFADRHRDDFRYSPGPGWMLWAENRWARDTGRRHLDATRRIVRARANLSDKAAESRRIATNKTVMGVAALAATDPDLVVHPDAFDRDVLELNTPAGLVDLRTGQLRSHDRDLVTRCAAVAPDRDAGCPTWHRFLGDVFAQSDEAIGFMRRFLGYCLTGYTREHVLGFFFGDGGNGKSTLLDFLLWLCGDYARKLPASLLMAQRGERHPTEIAQLQGVRLAVSSELDEGEFWAEARIKELTGDATATARFIRGDFFTFPLLCKIVIAGNHRPQIRAVDDALKRRMLLVPFTAKFAGAKRDPEMLAKLKAEAPAILAWLIEGTRDWLASGLRVPDSIIQASTEYADAMDSLGLWMGDCCHVSRDEFESESASLLYRSFGDWKRSRGEAVISMTRFAEQLRGRGFEHYRNNGARYRRLTLTSDEYERLRQAAAESRERP